MKLRYGSLIMMLVCTVSHVATADPMRYPYWQMIKDVIGSIETRPPRPLFINENNTKTDIEYPFEMFRHLRATDLLRAAREGAQEARLQAALGKPAEEIEALVLRNVSIALEYLPMLIRSDKDIEELALLLANRDEDSVLRLYLLQNSFPGMGQESFLSISLPEIIGGNNEAYNKWMLHVATHPSEKPHLQSMALQICYAWLRQEYERIINADPTIRAMLEADTGASGVELALNSGVSLSNETDVALRGLQARLHNFAHNMGGHIAEGSIRDEQVKQITREILEDMRDNIRGVNKSMINTLLEGKTLTSVPFPQSPQAPTRIELDAGSALPSFEELLQQMNPTGL